MQGRGDVKDESNIQKSQLGIGWDGVRMAMILIELSQQDAAGESLVEFVLGAIGEIFEVSLGLFQGLGLRVVGQAFVVDHVLEQLFGGFEVVPAPVERLLADLFLLLVVESVEVGMGQALLDGVPLVRVEG